MITVGSLFSGIGGLDLGLERAGMQVRWQDEINSYCTRVLEKHWPDVKRYGDIHAVDWKKVEPVDLICGGFPCQPISCAGRQKGDKDERWLWPEFIRAIREVRPRYALLENVPRLLSIDDGRLARGIFGDLAEAGYDSEWDCISAQDIGAPHIRERVFIVAQTSIVGKPLSRRCDRIPWGRSRSESADGYCGMEEGDVADSDSERFSRTSVPILKREPRQEDSNFGGASQRNVSDADRARFSDSEGRSTFTEFAGIRTTCYSDWWESEPDVGRVAYGVPSRVDRLKALGNAVVPQVSEEVARFIMTIDSEDSQNRVFREKPGEESR